MRNYLRLESSCALHRYTVLTATELPRVECHSFASEEGVCFGILGVRLDLRLVALEAVRPHTCQESAGVKILMEDHALR